MGFQRLDKLCRQVVSRMNLDAASSDERALPNEEKAVEAETPTELPGRGGRRGRVGQPKELPGSDTRTRSKDHWVVRPPVARLKLVANRDVTRPYSRSPSVGVTSRVAIVGGWDHRSSLPIHSI